MKLEDKEPLHESSTVASQLGGLLKEARHPQVSETFLILLLEIARIWSWLAAPSPDPPGQVLILRELRRFGHGKASYQHRKNKQIVCKTRIYTFQIGVL